jgi:hypothetical protein
MEYNANPKTVVASEIIVALWEYSPTNQSAGRNDSRLRTPQKHTCHRKNRAYLAIFKRDNLRNKSIKKFHSARVISRKRNRTEHNLICFSHIFTPEEFGIRGNLVFT